MACPDDSPLTRRGKPLQAGTNSKVVSGRLGHSTVSITLETYSYVIPSLQEDAARRAAVLVFAELGLRHVCKMLIRWNRKASRIAENPGSTWVFPAADSGDCRAPFRPPFNDLAVGKLVEVILSPRDSFAVVAALASGGDPVGDEIILGDDVVDCDRNI